MISLKKWMHCLNAALLIALLAGGTLHNATTEDNGLKRTIWMEISCSFLGNKLTRSITDRVRTG